VDGDWTTRWFTDVELSSRENQPPARQHSRLTITDQSQHSRQTTTDQSQSHAAVHYGHPEPQPPHSRHQTIRHSDAWPLREISQPRSGDGQIHNLKLGHSKDLHRRKCVGYQLDDEISMKRPAMYCPASQQVSDQSHCSDHRLPQSAATGHCEHLLQSRDHAAAVYTAGPLLQHYLPLYAQDMLPQSEQASGLVYQVVKPQSESELVYQALPQSDKTSELVNQALPRSDETSGLVYQVVKPQSESGLIYQALPQSEQTSELVYQVVKPKSESELVYQALLQSDKTSRLVNQALPRSDQTSGLVYQVVKPRSESGMAYQALPQSEQSSELVYQVKPQSESGMVYQALPQSKQTSGLVYQALPQSEQTSELVYQVLKPQSESGMVYQALPQSKQTSELVYQALPQSEQTSELVYQVLKPQSELISGLFHQALPQSESVSGRLVYHQAMPHTHEDRHQNQQRIRRADSQHQLTAERPPAFPASTGRLNIQVYTDVLMVGFPPMPLLVTARGSEGSIVFSIITKFLSLFLCCSVCTISHEPLHLA